MEPERSKDSRKPESDNADNVEQALDTAGDESGTDLTDPTHLERLGYEPFAAPEEPGEIARLLGNDAAAPLEERADDPLVAPADLTDPTNPTVSLEALDNLQDPSDASVPTGDAPLKVSEAEVEKLVQQIVDEIAARESSSAAPESAQLQGVVLRPKSGADTGQEETADTEAQQEPRTPPGADESSRAIDRFAGGIFRRPEPARESDVTTLPRIIVVVELADAATILEEERDATSTEMAATVESIADARIEYAEWVKTNERRAADYRLRR